MSTVFSALPEALQQTLEAQGIVRPTPIQSQAIPKALEGHDLCAQSQTGSGKTLAFTLPLALRLKSTEAKTFPRALVLTPTRELAQQIEMVFRTYLMPLQMRCLTIIGGNAYGKQKSALRDGVDVVIGTPGRIEDLLKRGHLHLDHVEIFVLDEVDQMLDVGFAESLDNIHRGLPDQHQTLLFSATLAPQTRKMAKLLLQDPVEIKISSSVRSPQQIEHFFVPVYKSKACSALMNLLLYHNPTQAIVFCETRQECREVTVALQQRGFQASALNSDLTQELRNETLQRFRNAELQYLIATNVAARGIDIDALPLVVNYNVPQSQDEYTHRTGRTGRRGESGQAWTLVNPKQRKRFNGLLKAHKISAKALPIPSKVQILERVLQRQIEEPSTAIEAEISQDIRELTERMLKSLAPEQTQQLLRSFLYRELRTMQAHENQDLAPTPEEYKNASGDTLNSRERRERKRWENRGFRRSRKNQPPRQKKRTWKKVKPKKGAKNKATGRSTSSK